MLQFLLTLTDESNHEKIERVYYAYHEYMMKCAMTKFKSYGRINYASDAEEAVQGAFIKIIKYVDNIDFSLGENSVKNYCLAILNNEICNVMSNNKEVLELDDESCTLEEYIIYDFVDELEIKEAYDRIVAAIEALDTKYSTTLQLVVSKGMKPDKIAELMGISTKTVYTRLARAKNLLFESLKGANLNLNG